MPDSQTHAVWGLVLTFGQEKLDAPNEIFPYTDWIELRSEFPTIIDFLEEMVNLGLLRHVEGGQILRTRTVMGKFIIPDNFRKAVTRFEQMLLDEAIIFRQEENEEPLNEAPEPEDDEEDLRICFLSSYIITMALNYLQLTSKPKPFFPWRKNVKSCQGFLSQDGFKTGPSEQLGDPHMVPSSDKRKLNDWISKSRVMPCLM